MKNIIFLLRVINFIYATNRLPRRGSMLLPGTRKGASLAVGHARGRGISPRKLRRERRFSFGSPHIEGRIAPWTSPNRRAATFCIRQGASGRPMAGREGAPTLPHKNIWCAGEKTHRLFGGAAMRNWIIACIRRYQQWKSPLHARCRFEPTCSEYMALAVQKYGALRGLWMGMKRISRCRPPHGGIEYP